MITWVSSSGPEPLDQAGLAWFNTLKNKYLALLPSLAAPTPSQAAAIAEINKVLAAPVSQVVQQHLTDLEDWLVGLLSGADLKQWVNSLRDDYRDIFGAEALQRILPTLVPQVSAATDVDLLAEARRLQSELHWHYSLQPWARQKRQEMMTGILITLISVFGVVGVIWGLSKVYHLTSKGLFSGAIILLGTLGGSISSIQRVQSADFTNSRAVSMARQERFALSVILSPLQGAFFALIFTLVLVAGVVTPGFVVPIVSLETEHCPSPSNAPTPTIRSATIPQLLATGRNGVLPPETNEMNIADGNLPTAGVLKSSELKKDTTNIGTSMTGAPKPDFTPPKDYKSEGSALRENKVSFQFFKAMLSFGGGKDVALLLLWAFIAGFSERLVPDLLSRMSETGKGASSTFSVDQ